MKKTSSASPAHSQPAATAASTSASPHKKVRQLFASCAEVYETLTCLVRSGVRHMNEIADKLTYEDVKRLRTLVIEYGEATERQGVEATTAISSAINQIARYVNEIASRPAMPSP